MASPARSSSCRAIATAFVRTIAPRVVVALEVERAGEPGEQPDPQLRLVVAERRGSASSSSSTAPWSAMPGPPAGVLVADRRPREQLRVAQLAGDVRRRRNASSASGALPPRWLAVPELEADARAPLGRDRRSRARARCAAAPPPRRRRAPRSAAPRGAQVVLDAALGAAERRRRGEVVGEVGERAAGASAGALERLADAQVQLRPPQPRQPVVERPPHELVGEAAGQPRRRGAPRSSRCRTASSSAASSSGSPRPGGARGRLELELRPGDGGELEQVGGLRRQARRAAG